MSEIYRAPATTPSFGSSDRTARARGSAAAVALLAGYALLLMAWIFSNPVGAAPDETAHYMKALQVGSGTLLGSSLSKSEFLRLWDYDPKKGQEHIDKSIDYLLSRKVFIPRELDPGNAACTAHIPLISARCEAQSPSRPLLVDHGTETYLTYMGTYHPFVYFPAGIVMDRMTNRDSAWMTGRLIFAAIAFLFLLLACIMQRNGRPGLVWLAGFVAATTPMIIATMATVTSSGIEICSALAFWACLLRLTRSPSPSRWAWAAFAVAGATLAAARGLGPLWVVLAVVMVATYHGWRNTLSVLRDQRVKAIVTLTLIGIACLVSVAWQVAVQPRPHLEVRIALSTFVHAFGSFPIWAAEVVGIFGWLDTTMPVWIYAVAMVPFVCVFSCAWAVACRRQRQALSLGIAIMIILPPALQALVANPAGGSVQSRWLLPFVAGFFVLSGEIIGLATPYHVSRLRLRYLLPTLLLGSSLLMFVAWYYNSRRYAVGASGRFFFLTNPEWLPPAGWGVWAAVAMLGCASLVLAAYIAWRRIAEPRRGVV